MPLKRIVIATRGSALALWQAEHIKARLETQYPGLSAELVLIKTTGDKIQDVPLSKVGGKGLFVKEIEEALLDGRADIAVHSMKDVPMELPEGLVLGAVPERENPTDVFLSTRYPSLNDLPIGARVGTSSLRRQAQLLALRPDLSIISLRGNVDTRLRKLTEGHFDAILLATAALNRLGLSAPYRQELGPPDFLPATGQGALGIEFCRNRADLHEALSFLNHPDTHDCVLAERAFLKTLDGGCQVPIAAHAVLTETKEVLLTGLIAGTNGKNVLRAQQGGTRHHAAETGVALAHTLLERGGRELLAELYASAP